MWSVSWKDGELVPCEFLPETQRKLLRISLYGLRQEYEKTGWALVPLDVAMEEIIPGNMFVFVGDKIMGVSAAKPWFSSEGLVVEEFVDYGIPLDTVVAVLKASASIYGVRRYAVGTRAAMKQRHSALARLYEREGLSVSTIELTGVI